MATGVVPSYLRHSARGGLGGRTIGSAKNFFGLGSIRQLVELGPIRFDENSVYSFTFLKPEVCQWIIEEQESFEASELVSYIIIHPYANVIL